MMATMSARECNRDVSDAKRQAKHGPVAITDLREPACVLLSIEERRRPERQKKPLLDRLSMVDDFDIDFEPVRIDLKAPDL